MIAGEGRFLVTRTRCGRSLGLLKLILECIFIGRRFENIRSLTILDRHSAELALPLTCLRAPWPSSMLSLSSCWSDCSSCVRKFACEASGLPIGLSTASRKRLDHRWTEAYVGASSPSEKHQRCLVRGGWCNLPNASCSSRRISLGRYPRKVRILMYCWNDSVIASDWEKTKERIEWTRD